MCYMVRGLFCPSIRFLRALIGDSNSTTHRLLKGVRTNQILYPMKVKEKDLRELLDHISSSYVGDYASVSHDLYKAVYCLHFLEPEAVPRDEVHNLCFALHKLGEGFHLAHNQRRMREHKEYTKREYKEKFNEYTEKFKRIILGE